MSKEEVLDKMVRVANSLDDIGFNKEADKLDLFITKLAIDPKTIALNFYNGINNADTLRDLALNPTLKLVVKKKIGPEAFKELMEIIAKKGGVQAVSSVGARGAAATGVAVLNSPLVIAVSTFLTAYQLTRWFIGALKWFGITDIDKKVTDMFYNIMKSMGYSDSDTPNKEEMMKIYQQNKEQMIIKLKQGAKVPQTQPVGKVQTSQKPGASPTPIA